MSDSDKNRTEEEKRTALTAKEKKVMFMTTLFVAAFVYLADQIFAFLGKVLELITRMPAYAWLALLGIVVLGTALGAFAIHRALGLGRIAIERDRK